MKEKENNRKKVLLIVGVLLAVFVVIGASFAYYSAAITKVNETNTKIETNTLGLIYNGTKEINYQSMIPGDSFEKTFTVENTSNTSVTYNIYMQGITNEYNEDLVYTLYETDSNGANPVEVVQETTLPATNNDKWYLKTNISIAAAPTIKYYKLVVEYKYLANAPQNDYQGKVFEATLGIDTVQNASNPEQAASISYWQPTYYAYPVCKNYTNLNCSQWEDVLSTSSSTEPPTGRSVYTAMDSEGNEGVCIVRDGIQHCFQVGSSAWSFEIEHLKQVFSEEDDTCFYDADYKDWICRSEDYEYYCSIDDSYSVDPSLYSSTITCETEHGGSCSIYLGKSHGLECFE